MIPTQKTINVINYANSILIDLKGVLINAENEAVDIREKTDIKAVRNHIQAGLFEIIRTFFPSKPFDAKAFLHKETDADREHHKRMQEILTEAKTHLEENEKLGKGE